VAGRRSRAGSGKARPADTDEFGDDERRAPAAPVDPADRARDICLRQLTDGPRTAAQLGTAMARRGIEPEVADAVLARLADVGLIDDAAFAAAWVTSRHAGRGLARRALAHELRTRGVADPLVAEAVAELDPDQETATARELATKRLAATRGLDVTVRFRRTAALLARKGYPSQLAYRVIREALEAERDGAVEEFPDLVGSLDD
jgi:regulatory protein